MSLRNSIFAAITTHALRLIAVICFFSSAPSLDAQTTDLNVGQLPDRSYQINDFDEVNLSNGNLVLKIPLLFYPQRGKISTAELSVRGNSNTWGLAINGAGQPAWGPVWDGRFPPQLAPMFTPDIRQMNSHSKDPPPAVLYYTSCQAIDASGAFHPIMDFHAGSYVQCIAKPSPDASGIAATGVSQIYGDFFGPYTDWKGNRSGRLDVNGNAIIHNADHSITDTIGRAIPQTPTTPASPGCTTVNYPGPNGGTVPLTLCYISKAANGQMPKGPTLTWSLILLQSISLPNGASWLFDYDEYDSIKKNYTPDRRNCFLHLHEYSFLSRYGN